MGKFICERGISLCFEKEYSTMLGGLKTRGRRQ